MTVLQEIAEEKQKLLPYMIQPDRSLHFLRPGRLVRVIEGPNDWRWGIVLAVRKAPTTNGKVCYFTVTPLPHRGVQCESEFNRLMSGVKEGPNDWGRASCWLSKKRYTANEKVRHFQQPKLDTGCLLNTLWLCDSVLRVSRMV